MNEAGNAIGRRDMGNGAIGARANFMSALIAFQQGNLSAGEQLLTTVWKYQQSGSFWLFHIGLVDRAVIDNRSAATSAIAFHCNFTMPCFAIPHLRIGRRARWNRSPY